MRLAVSAVAGTCLLVFATPQLQAEVSVTLSKTHLCCGACLKAVDKALEGVEGVTHESDQKKQTVALKAADLKAAKKAIDALAKAGFYGTLDTKEIKFEAVEAPKGDKTTRLQVSGVHNCCGACSRAIKKAVSDVAGVAAETVQPRESSFVVEGEFNAAAIVESLLKAGFYVQVK